MRGQSERGFTAVGLVATLLVAAALFAIPLVLMARMQDDSARRAAATANEARDALAQLDLTNAIRTAEVYRADHGSYEGFNPQVASSLDPNTTYDTASTAAPRRVSIRAVSAANMVLVTRSASGQALCAVAGTTGPRYGNVDALTPRQCA